jgi:ATP-dependent Lon protease
MLDEVLRKVIVLIQKSNKELQNPIQINTQNIGKLIHKPYEEALPNYSSQKELPVGTCIALGYIKDGHGSIMHISTQKINFTTKEKQFIVTGNLKQVMSESISLAMLNAQRLLHNKFPDKYSKEFTEGSYHFHCSQTDIPKDGPSAGCAMVLSLISLMTNKPLPSNLSTTGEISAIGEVNRIGGIREKLTACKSNKISEIIVPIANKKDVEILSEEFKEGLTIYYASTVEDLYNVAFREPGQEIKCEHTQYKASKNIKKEEIMENNELDRLLKAPPN